MLRQSIFILANGLGLDIEFRLIDHFMDKFVAGHSWLALLN